MKNPKTPIFSVPRSSRSWRGSEGVWICISGWAKAGKDIFGTAYVSTSDGVFQPEESTLFPLQTTHAQNIPATHRTSFKALLPTNLVTLLKDIKFFSSRPSKWPIESYISKSNIQVSFVWERHDLFPGVGYKLSKRLKVPFILFVDAPVVWEAKKWGVKRPFWGWWLEKYVETKSLKSADLVLCVSNEIKEKLSAMGIPGNKVLVTPNKVNTQLFHPGVDGRQMRKTLGLTGKIVLGWIGSFRRFHGIESLLRAFSLVLKTTPGVKLMLVGGGQMFDQTKASVRQLGIESNVIFTGKKPFDQVPQLVAAFDIALVSASSSEEFHYSPLKLREYFACGKAVIAPSVGDISTSFENKKHLLFYKVNDIEDLKNKMLLVIQDLSLRKKLENGALEIFEKEGSWYHELNRVGDYLKLF